MDELRLRRLKTLMEPEPGNPREVEGVLNPAAARGPGGALYLFPRLVARHNYSASSRGSSLGHLHRSLRRLLARRRIHACRSRRIGAPLRRRMLEVRRSEVAFTHADLPVELARARFLSRGLAVEHRARDGSRNTAHDGTRRDPGRPCCQPERCAARPPRRPLGLVDDRPRFIGTSTSGAIPVPADGRLRRASNPQPEPRGTDTEQSAQALPVRRDAGPFAILRTTLTSRDDRAARRACDAAPPAAGSVLPERSRDAEVHVRLERLLVLAVEHVGPRT